MKSKWKERIRRYLSLEIAIEYKSCLYFSCIMFFYFVYLMVQKIFYANVVNMFEMILTAYGIVYIQVYLLGNFDEGEQLGRRNALYMISCTCLYAGASFLLNWFGRESAVTALFFVYMLFVYFFVFLCNKIKRIVDTENLNKMLNEYKKIQPKERV